MRKAYKILIRKPEGRTRCRWEDNILFNYLWFIYSSDYVASNKSMINLYHMGTGDLNIQIMGLPAKLSTGLMV
jgi:hypothetical protein